VVTTSLLTFAVFTAESLRWHHINGTSLLDGETDPVGHNLVLHAAIVWVLFAVPLVNLPFGIIGAALGAQGSKGHQAAAASPTPAAQPSDGD
jgi:hypothetical protein